MSEEINYKFGEHFTGEYSHLSSKTYSGESHYPYRERHSALDQKKILKVSTRVWREGMTAKEATQVAIDLMNEASKAKGEFEKEVKTTPKEMLYKGQPERAGLIRNGKLRKWDKTNELIKLDDYLLLILPSMKASDRLKRYKEWLKKNEDRANLCRDYLPEEEKDHDGNASSVFLRSCISSSPKDPKEFIESLDEPLQYIARQEYHKELGIPPDLIWNNFESLTSEQQDELILGKLSRMRKLGISRDLYETEAYYVALWHVYDSQKRLKEARSKGGKTKAKKK